MTSYFTSVIEADEKKTNKSKRRVFFIKQYEGVIQARRSILFNVYFEPNYHGNVRWDLRISIENNAGDLVIQLKGCGLQPELKITENSVVFEPTLPYTPNYEKIFTIENVTNFPIEIYFADFD